MLEHRSEVSEPRTGRKFAALRVPVAQNQCTRKSADFPTYRDYRKPLAAVRAGAAGE
jgi:hypothetical protein